MEIALSLLVALVGVLMYALCAQPKLAEIGKIMFTVGVLAFLICFCNSPHTFGIVPK